MKARSALIIGVACAVAGLGLVLWLYPWSVYYGNFTYGAEITARSYLVVAILLGLVTSICAYSQLAASRPSLAKRCLVAGLLSLGILTLVSLAFGPLGIDIPFTRTSGIFFSEFKFLTFICEVAVPISILGGALMWPFGRRAK